MVKPLLFIFLFLSILDASSFKENCIVCHSNGYQFNMFMKKYTLKYSSEKRVKKAIFEYLKHPSFKKSVLPYGFLNRFGIKEESFLDDEELIDMIDIYYEKYNMKSKIY